MTNLIILIMIVFLLVRDIIVVESYFEFSKLLKKKFVFRFLCDLNFSIICFNFVIRFFMTIIAIFVSSVLNKFIILKKSFEINDMN